MGGMPYNQKWRVSNRDRISAYNKQYRIDNKGQVSIYNHEYHIKNRDQISVYNREYRIKNKVCLGKYNREYSRRHVLNLRSQFFDIYGKECASCHESNLRFLTVSHKCNDGHADRVEKGDQMRVIKHAICHIDFTKYETLCWNCNCGARANDGLSTPQTRHSKYVNDLRSRFFEIYGNECVCCHERNRHALTVGHPLNDGKQDRSENGGSVGVMIRAIRRHDFTRYETQCFNCNLGASVNGGVCPHKNNTMEAGS